MLSLMGAGPKVRARWVVLAMGGVETTRMLLSTQLHLRHFGGVDGALGRYYMGHISGKIADIIFNDPAAAFDLDFKLDDCGAYLSQALDAHDRSAITSQITKHGILAGQSSFLRSKTSELRALVGFPGAGVSPAGRRLLPEAIRLAHTGPRPYPLGAHLRNVVLGAPHGAIDIFRILRDRFLRSPRKPGFLVPNREGRYALHYHAEQIPNPDSRIQLSDETDAHGLARVRINFRYSDRDVQSVIDSHLCAGRGPAFQRSWPPGIPFRQGPTETGGVGTGV